MVGGCVCNTQTLKKHGKYAIEFDVLNTKDRISELFTYVKHINATERQ